MPKKTLNYFKKRPVFLKKITALITNPVIQQNGQTRFIHPATAQPHDMDLTIPTFRESYKKDPPLVCSTWNKQVEGP